MVKRIGEGFAAVVFSLMMRSSLPGAFYGVFRAFHCKPGFCRWRNARVPRFYLETSSAVEAKF